MIRQTSTIARRREWQHGSRLYRDTTQFCIDGWENGDFDKSVTVTVTTSRIDNALYSALQTQAIREAKSDHSEDGEGENRESQPFAVNNQNWEIDTTDNGTVVVVGFPCVSQWWYTPIELYDDITAPGDRLLEDDADKTRLQLYRRGDDWFCTVNIEYDTEASGETPIGVDIGERHILGVTAYDEGESMLVSGEVVRRNTFDANIGPYAIRFRKRVQFMHATAWVIKRPVGFRT